MRSGNPSLSAPSRLADEVGRSVYAEEVDMMPAAAGTETLTNGHEAAGLMMHYTLWEVELELFACLCYLKALAWL